MNEEYKRWIEDHQFEITIAVIIVFEVLLVIYMLNTKGGFTL